MKQESANHVEGTLDICDLCRHRGKCYWAGRVFMTPAGRFMLFMLSSLCTVIIPAVMLNLYNTLTNIVPQAEPLIIAVCLIPLVIVLLVCFAGLHYSIFKLKHCPKFNSL